MAAFQKATNGVTSRDFTAGGFMYALANFLVAPAVSGGAGWHMMDDRRTDPLNPYIVVSDLASPAWNSLAKIMQIQMLSASERILVRYWLWWDAASHTGVFEWHQGALTTVTGNFVYDFRGGPEALFIASRIGTSNYVSHVDEFEAITSFGMPNAAISTLSQKAFLDSGNGAGYLSGFHNITGYKTALDANGELHFSLVNTAGSTYRIDIFKDLARTIRVGFTGTFTNSTTGTKAISAEAGYTIGGTITNPITVAANTTIKCQFLRLHLQTGQGASFEANKQYMLFNVTGTTLSVRSFKVEAVNADILTIDSISAVDFPVGTVAGVYPHRFTAFSTHYFDNGVSPIHSLPYMTVAGSEVQTKNGLNDARADWAYYTGITDMSPDHEGRYPMMRPVIKESVLESSGATTRKNFGKLKNIMLSSEAGLLEFQFGRELNGAHWMPYYLPGGRAHLIRDDASLS
jgi:hypothetical protein